MNNTAMDSAVRMRMVRPHRNELRGAVKAPRARRREAIVEGIVVTLSRSLGTVAEVGPAELPGCGVIDHRMEYS